MTEDINRVIRSVDREVDKAKEIGALLESMGDVDPESLLLSLESETNLPEMVCKIYDAILEYDIYASGLKSKIEDLSERKTRIERSAETLRGVIFIAMEKANLQKVSHICATLSIKKTARQTVINDEMLIPSDYWKRPDPELDKSKIKEDLKAGVDIPGCTLSNGGAALSIRVK